MQPRGRHTCHRVPGKALFSAVLSGQKAQEALAVPGTAAFVWGGGPKVPGEGKTRMMAGGLGRGLWGAGNNRHVPPRLPGPYFLSMTTSRGCDHNGGPGEDRKTKDMLSGAHPTPESCP